MYTAPPKIVGAYYYGRLCSVLRIPLYMCHSKSLTPEANPRLLSSIFRYRKKVYTFGVFLVSHTHNPTTVCGDMEKEHAMDQVPRTTLGLKALP